jgi:putative ABC transport system permease protein
MSVVWKKVWRDLTLNKSRTILAVLSTSVGVFALGLVVNMSDMMNGSIRGQVSASKPGHIQLFAGPVVEEQEQILRKREGVVDAEAMINSYFRWKREDETEWRDANLVGRRDYEALRVSLLQKTAGEWPGEKTLVMEQATMDYFGLHVGDTILVEHGNSVRPMKLVGAARSTQAIPPQYQGGNQATFFATPETIEWLTGRAVFNQVDIRLEEWDRARGEETARRIEEQMKEAGLSTGGFELVEPGFHFAQELLDGVFIVLTGMGIISLGLSAFLIINTLNALLSQQIWQIGIFKVVGATFARVVRIYLGVALLYGVMALLLAVPASALGAKFMSAWMLSTINVAPGRMELVPSAVILQVAVGLMVPVLAALIPVVGGARTSCRQAISNYGLGGGFGNSLVDRLFLRAQQALPVFRAVPRPAVLSLRNTFRRKARLLLTLATLTLGGVMYITVMGVGLSLNHMLDIVTNDFGFDVLMVFDRPERMEKIAQIAERVPNVGLSEGWDVRGARLKFENGEDVESQVWALPPDTGVFRFNIAAGRALLPEDDRAILINRKVAQDYGVQVGDTVTLDVKGGKSEWTIVGLVINMNNMQRDSFVPLRAMMREIGSLNRAQAVAIGLKQKDPQAEKAAISMLREKFLAEGLTPVHVEGVSQMRENNQYQFNLLVNILLIMAVLAAVVGSLGLAGTMSINVVERGREIGLMRAIGAASPTVGGIFVGEGLLLGIVSWLLAIPFSVPGGILLTKALAVIIPLDFVFSVQGAAAWFLIVSVMAVIASLWPAVRATRISVRESLAYE